MKAYGFARPLAQFRSRCCRTRNRERSWRPEPTQMGAGPTQRGGPHEPIPLRENLGDRLAVVDLQALVAGNIQLAGVETELVQDGGMKVGDVVAVLDRMVA